MKRYRVKVRGVAPLLQGRKDPREEPPRGGKERQDFYDSAWKYTHYADREGNLGQPAHIIKRVIVAGLRETARAGDVQAGKGKTEAMARAGLRIEPALCSLGSSAPDDPPVLGVAEAFALQPEDEPKVFVLKRLSSRGVEISNLAVNGWELEFNLIDTTGGYFNAEWLERAIRYSFSYSGMGTWRPEFGRAEVVGFEEVSAQE